MDEVYELPSPSSSGSEDNDFDVTPVDVLMLREDLEDCLTNVQSDGSFALSETLSDAPNPGLCLKDAGLIGLPLSHSCAQSIISASHQAPFGKGEDTIVDVNVRKTWEVSPGDFELTNPAWQAYLKSIVAKVSAGLGVDKAGRGVVAELYKLLLYETGAMFKPHQDSEKAPGMFATLVIALPSKHQGGEVRVTHAGTTEVFETAKSSAFDCSYLAWFADVTHEVRPVISGYRLVLTYNLIHTSFASEELSADSDRGMAQLRSLFSQWKSNIEKVPSMPTSLAFLFEHQYTDTSLRFSGLKGHDRQVAAHLRKVCDEHGFYFYLANLETYVEGGCDEGEEYGYGDHSEFHDIIEECDRQTSLKRIVELDGSEAARDLKYKEEFFIQQDPFESVDPDQEEYSGYTGNEGVSATHFYRRTAAILVCKSRRMEFFLSPSSMSDDYAHSWSAKPIERSKVDVWLDRLLNEFAGNPGNHAAQEDLYQICEMVVRQTKTWNALLPSQSSWRQRAAPFSDETLARIVTTAVTIDNRVTFLDAYHLCCDKVLPSIFRSVGIAFLRYDLKSLIPALRSQLAAISSFAILHKITDEFQTGVNSETSLISRDPELYLDWIKPVVHQAISSLEMVSAEDGAVLAGLSKRSVAQIVFNEILPAVKRNVNHTPMALAFLVGLFDEGITGDISENVAWAVFKDVVSDLADQFSLQTLNQTNEASKRIETANSWASMLLIQPKPEPAPDHVNSKNIASLLRRCILLGLETEMDQLVTKLVGEVTRAPLDLFEVIYLPILKVLIDMLSGDDISPRTSLFRRVFQMILGDYIVRYVQPEPVSPIDWKRPQISCHCKDCQGLNEFLRSPQMKVGRFAVNKQRRAHLHQMLDGTGVTHETERRGSPQTLVVTKNLNNHNATRNAWKKRCAVAQKHIEDLNTGLLAELLAEMYEAVLSLSVHALVPTIKALHATSPPNPPAPLSETKANRILPPVTRRKVPGDVIVLD